MIEAARGRGSSTVARFFFPIMIFRLFALALLRVVAGVVDVAWLCTRPALLHWWWVAKRLPTYTRAADDSADAVYGEVFVAPTSALLRACGVRAGSVVVDVGCGAGQVLIAARALGAEARGIELDPRRALPHHARAAGADVVIADATEAVDVAVDVGAADVVWCSWLTWSSATRAALTAQLAASMKKTALLVVVGDAPVGFDVVARTTMWCSWGRADVVVGRRR